MTYTGDWFEWRRGRSLQDAMQIVFETRLAIGHVPESIVDFGCGDGAGLQVWRELVQAEHQNRKSTPIVIGIDPYGPETWMVEDAEGKPRLGIDSTHLRMDLARPIRFESQFGLAVCLEVAEHLPEQAAATLVESLCSASTRVLFSAAVPGQGGDGHTNEQPLSYWKQHFAVHGYVLQDLVRWRLPEEVSWWYRQNVVLFCKRGHEITLPDFELLVPAYSVAGADRAHKFNTELSQRAQWLAKRGLKVPDQGLLRVVGGQACIDKARSELASCFVAEKRTRPRAYSLWCDDDMVPDIQHDFIDLLVAAHHSNREVLAGFAPKKMLPSRIAHSMSLWGHVVAGPGAPQQPFDSLGFGIIVVHRRAFERIDRWSLENPWHPWAVKSTLSGPRKPMRDYFRPTVGEPDPRFVDLETGEWRRAYLNEDAAFCHRLTAAGGSLWAMPQAFPGHEGTFVFKREHVE